METTVPHNYKPRDYQLPFWKAMDSGIKRAVLIWHRRSGKDRTSWNYIVREAVENKGLYYYFAPTYTQGKKIIWDGIDARTGLSFIDHIPKQLLSKKNDTELKIELVNGSIIQVIGTDRVDSIVGTNPVGCVFTEYSLQNPKAWDLIRPILAENGGWAVFVFTPRGMNHGHKILQQVRDAGGFTQVLTVEDTKAIDVKVLEQEKSQMPKDLFEQEYFCKFVEGASQFFIGLERCLYLPDNKIEPWHKFRLGVDLAKYQDFTVLTAINLHTRQVYQQERFNQIDWQMQKSMIEAFYHRYNKGLVWLDSTGLGDPIYDDLLSRGINIESFKFTSKSRMDLLNNLRILINENQIYLPADDEGLLDELRSMQYTMTERGRINVQVPEGVHDDRIMSLALAVWDLPARMISKETNDPVKRLLSIRENIHNDLGDAE